MCKREKEKRKRKKRDKGGRRRGGGGHKKVSPSIIRLLRASALNPANTILQIYNVK